MDESEHDSESDEDVAGTFDVLETLRQAHESNTSALDRIVADAERAEEVARALDHFTTASEARYGGALALVVDAARAAEDRLLNADIPNPVRDYDSLLSSITSRHSLDEVMSAWQRVPVEEYTSPFSRMVEEATSYATRLTAKDGYGSALSRMVEESTAYVGIAERMREMDDRWLSAAERLSAFAEKPHTMALLSAEPDASILNSLQAASRNPDVLNSLRSSLYADPAADLMNRITERVSPLDLTTAVQRAFDPATTSALDAVYERLDVSAIEDEDDFDEVATRVLREVQEDVDIDAPPTPEEMSSREALIALLKALRPDVSSDPTLHQRLRRYVGTSSGLFYLYLRVFHPDLFIALAVLLELVGLYALVGEVVDRTIAGGKSPSDIEDQDD